MNAEPQRALGIPAAFALRRLSAAGARIWLVRPDALEAAAAFGLVLLHQLPSLLVTLGREVQRHG